MRVWVYDAAGGGARSASFGRYVNALRRKQEHRVAVFFGGSFSIGIAPLSSMGLHISRSCCIMNRHKVRTTETDIVNGKNPFGSRWGAELYKAPV